MTAERSARKPALATTEADDDAEMTPLVVWAARLSVLLLARGGLLLLAYGFYGFDTDPNDFALGFRLDPLNAAVQCAWGVVGSIIGFYRPRYATAFVLAFASFYTVAVLLGAFTPYDLGAGLGNKERIFFWLMAVSGWAVGLYGLWQDRRGTAA